MPPFSVCTITLNEERNLPRALASVRGVVDEIVVVDCGSKDRTREIAREHGAEVFERAWTSYEEQWNFAASCATNQWVFVLAADEELGPELRASLLKWKQQEPEFSVYEMARRAWYLGAWIKHCGWYPDYQRRLYRRDSARFAESVAAAADAGPLCARVGVQDRDVGRRPRVGPNLTVDHVPRPARGRDDRPARRRLPRS